MRPNTHARIDHWGARTASTDRGDHAAAVALLRAVYDMIDRVKTWEQDAGLDGTSAWMTTPGASA